MTSIHIFAPETHQCTRLCTQPMCTNRTLNWKSNSRYWAPHFLHWQCCKHIFRVTRHRYSFKGHWPPANASITYVLGCNPHLLITYGPCWSNLCWVQSIGHFCAFPKHFNNPFSFLKQVNNPNVPNKLHLLRINLWFANLLNMGTSACNHKATM